MDFRWISGFHNGFSTIAYEISVVSDRTPRPWCFHLLRKVCHKEEKEIGQLCSSIYCKDQAYKRLEWSWDEAPMLSSVPSNTMASHARPRSSIEHSTRKEWDTLRIVSRKNVRYLVNSGIPTLCSLWESTTSQALCSQL